MIVGRGLISTLFEDFRELSDVLIFASGVSNSLENSEGAFLREKEMVNDWLGQFPNAVFVYFSTTSIEDQFLARTIYVCHKRDIEETIRKRAKRFIIFRLSQVFGSGGNSRNLVNTLMQTIESRKPVTVYSKAKRNIIGINDVKQICSLLIRWPTSIGRTINVASPWNVGVDEIVSVLEEHCGISTERRVVDEGYPIEIATPDVISIGYRWPASSFRDYFSGLLKNGSF